MAVGEVGEDGHSLLQWELATAAGAQFLLFAFLGSTVGLTTAGWVAGVAFTVGCWSLLSLAFGCVGARSLGPPNRVTLARVLLIGGVTVLAVSWFGGRAPVGTMVVMVVFASIALLLDTVDGWVARRTGTESDLGARFDIEADAFLVLVLSGFVAVRSGLWWALSIGGMRYAFVAAAWVLPWLGGPLPYSRIRKLIGATQGIAVLIAASGVLPPGASAGVVAVALALLCWSFARDVVGLWAARKSSYGA